MGALPTIPATIEQLRRYRAKQAITTAALVALIDIFSGETWSADHVDDILAGRRKFTAHEEQIIKRFLLDRFYAYNNS